MANECGDAMNQQLSLQPTDRSGTGLIDLVNIDFQSPEASATLSWIRPLEENSSRLTEEPVPNPCYYEVASFANTETVDAKTATLIDFGDGSEYLECIDGSSQQSSSSPQDEMLLTESSARGTHPDQGEAISTLVDDHDSAPVDNADSDVHTSHVFSDGGNEQLDLWANDHDAHPWRKEEAGLIRSSLTCQAVRGDVYSSSPMSSPPQIFSSSPFLSSQSSAESDEATDKSEPSNLRGLPFFDGIATFDLGLESGDIEASLPHGEARGENLAQESCSVNDKVRPGCVCVEDGVDGQVDIPAMNTDAPAGTNSAMQHEIEIGGTISQLTPLIETELYRLREDELHGGSKLVQSHTDYENRPNQEITGTRAQVEPRTSAVLGKRSRPTSQVDLSGPSTKRPKVGLFQKQEKKLSTPFRTPAMKKLNMVIQGGSPPKVPDQNEDRMPGKNGAAVADHSPSKMLVESGFDIKEKHRTKRASLQFKSPLVHKIPSGMSAIRLTPTIQGLEHRLQHLKRAVKIRQEGDADVLRELIRKWTEAGREVAYEVWNLVKDCNGSKWEDGGSEFKDSWGWAHDENQMDHIQGAGGEIIADDREQDNNEEVQGDSLGTMLHQLGIAHETLGWKEEEGIFQDD